MAERSEDRQRDSKSCVIYTRNLREGYPRADFTISGLNAKGPTQGLTERKDSRNICLDFASGDIAASGFLDIIDTFDRPPDAYANGLYAESGTYAVAPENKPGKRFHKTGAYAQAGVGRARAEVSFFEVEAKGPNASAGAEATVGRLSIGAMARAEIASASAKAGPFNFKVGIGVDTGASLSLQEGLNVKILGCGFSYGPRISISILGSELSIAIL